MLPTEIGVGWVTAPEYYSDGTPIIKHCLMRVMKDHEGELVIPTDMGTYRRIKAEQIDGGQAGIRPTPAGFQGHLLKV